MAIRGQPERRRSRSFPLVVAWLTGKITGVGLWPGSCFSPVFYRKNRRHSCSRKPSRVHARFSRAWPTANDLFLVEIDDLDAVAIGVVEIGVTAGGRGGPSLGIF